LEPHPRKIITKEEALGLLQERYGKKREEPSQTPNPKVNLSTLEVSLEHIDFSRAQDLRWTLGLINLANPIPSQIQEWVEDTSLPLNPKISSEIQELFNSLENP